MCGLYAQAQELHEQGVRLISSDEKTGIQALERKHPDLPLRPGKVQRREHEYIRHGTQTLIANFEVATGKILMPSLGPTRTEADFAAHIAQTIDTEPEASWIFIVDQLNTHQSESLVRLVIARGDGIAHQDLLNRLSDADLLIIDDFLTIGIDPVAASDLFAILANREHRRPTIVASQSGPDYWAQTLPDRVAADSIVNRLANNSRKINLGTLDMRKQGNQAARKKPDYWE